MVKCLINLCSRQDGTHDILKWGTFLGMVVMCLGFVHTVYLGHTVDFQAFGIGFGAIVTACGLGVGARAAGERPPNQEGA